MEEYVVPIFLAALAGTTLSLGAWLVHAVRRDLVVTWQGVVTRAGNPLGYWLLALWHWIGLTVVIAAAAATTLYALLDAFA